MRRALTLAGLAVGLALALIWLTGGFDALALWLVGAQRAAQDSLAGAVRALRAGEAGAMAALIGVCFGYGVLHAAGPGHGKALIGGYGLARRVPVLRLSVLALVASLAQAGVAVALVHAAIGLLGLARDTVTGAGEAWVTAAGNLMVAGLGLWLLVRGGRGLLRQTAGGGAGHGADGHHHDHGDGCGHAHGPTAAEASAVGSLRDAALLVAGIAMRPCSGALFLLILTWQLGIGAAGIAGALAMGLGTASVTVGVALVAAWAREGVLAMLPASALARALPLVEVLAGAVILVAALLLLARAG